ncbi:MAG: hypothetical protein HOE90_04895 [Bacteriovoracaceae bacterium]|nr:hypothetical protein [Bacteriovoracaceae bacterium]
MTLNSTYLVSQTIRKVELFYDSWLLVAEVPALLVLSLYQVAQDRPYRQKGPDYLKAIREKVCKKIVFTNPSYKVCELN